MSERIQQLAARLPRVKLWVVVATVSALVLFGYNSLQGKQYWDASQEVNATSAEIAVVARSLARPAPKDADSIDSELESSEYELEQLRTKFIYPTTDELMSILSTTAIEVPIDLVSIAIGRGTPAIEEGILYNTQPVSITLQGRIGRIYTFLERLQDKAPVTQVSDIRMTSGDGGNTVARVQLLFYLSPQIASEEESAD